MKQKWRRQKLVCDARLRNEKAKKYNLRWKLNEPSKSKEYWIIETVLKPQVGGQMQKWSKTY